VVLAVSDSAKSRSRVRTHVQEYSMGSITDSQTPNGDDDMVIHARKQLILSRARQRLVLVLIAKDLADGLIALQDLVGATCPAVLNWRSVRISLSRPAQYSFSHIFTSCRVQSQACIANNSRPMWLALCILKHLEVMATMILASSLVPFH
jgi:hypothetical protein